LTLIVTNDRAYQLKAIEIKELIGKKLKWQHLRLVMMMMMMMMCNDVHLKAD